MGERQGSAEMCYTQVKQSLYEAEYEALVEAENKSTSTFWNVEP